MGKFNWQCDAACGFEGRQEEEGRVGYLTAFEGLGLKEALKADITVYSPYNNSAAPSYAGVKLTEGKVTVIGIIEWLKWDGNIGDRFEMRVVVSATNKKTLATLKVQTLVNDHLTKIGWWTGNYDKVVKCWYEEHYPKTAETFEAQIESNDQIIIDEHPIQHGAQFFYGVRFPVYSAADKFVDFLVATGSGDNQVKHWGIEVAK